MPSRKPATPRWQLRTRRQRRYPWELRSAAVAAAGRCATACLPPRPATGCAMQGMLRCDTMYLIELSKERAMAATSMVHVRVDDHIKTQATETLAAMGLTVSDAIRVFLTRVVADQQLPFALQAPNPDTRAAMEEARAMSKARFASARALIDDLEKVAKQ